MIDQSWPRIGAIAIEKNGDIGAAWLTYDRNTDGMLLYDCCIFRREAPAVIVEGLNARGRFVPVAYAASSKAFADDLLKRGVNMMFDQADDSQAMAEVVSRAMAERMRSGRFRVERRLAEWLEEMERMQRHEGPVPLEGFPVMTAARFALQMMEHARKPPSTVGRRNLYPKVAIV